MGNVFVSYSTSDKYFAEILQLKLEEANISVWLDRDALLAGETWRDAIDLGIDQAEVVIVVLSPQSCQSHYVTYEWATGMAKKKIIVPVLLSECDRHPKLEPIQYLDFKNHSSETWQKLVVRVQSALGSDEAQENETPSMIEVRKNRVFGHELNSDDKLLTEKIMGYMNNNGFRLLSFSRIIKRFDPTRSEQELKELVNKSSVFKHAKLKGNLDGLALL